MSAAVLNLLLDGATWRGIGAAAAEHRMTAAELAAGCLALAARLWQVEAGATTAMPPAPPAGWPVDMDIRLAVPVGLMTLMALGEAARRHRVDLLRQAELALIAAVAAYVIDEAKDPPRFPVASELPRRWRPRQWRPSPVLHQPPAIDKRVSVTATLMGDPGCGTSARQLRGESAADRGGSAW